MSSTVVVEGPLLGAYKGYQKSLEQGLQDFKRALGCDNNETLRNSINDYSGLLNYTPRKVQLNS